MLRSQPTSSTHLTFEDRSDYGGYHNSHYGGYGTYYHDCCPLVIDPKTFLALMSFIALATYFLQQRIINSNLMMPGKRRKRWILQGKIQICSA